MQTYIFNCMHYLCTNTEINIPLNRQNQVEDSHRFRSERSLFLNTGWWSWSHVADVAQYSWWDVWSTATWGHSCHTEETRYWKDLNVPAQVLSVKHWDYSWSATNRVRKALMSMWFYGLLVSLVETNKPVYSDYITVIVMQSMASCTEYKVSIGMLWGNSVNINRITIACIFPFLFLPLIKVIKVYISWPTRHFMHRIFLFLSLRWHWSNLQTAV